METTETTSNRAAWIVKTGSPLVVKSADAVHAEADQIVIKTYAVAVNPIDWILQHLPMIFPHLKAPFILGSDVAGQIIEVGPNVARFKIGDRVIGHAVGYNATSSGNREGGFREYVVLRENLTSPIPDTMRFEDACVLPLGLSTAACGMYQKDYLALQPPSTSPKPTGETLIVWGASTSVGSNAVQLARASGYEVIATASPKNFEYVKKLGAKAVFNYRSKTVVGDIVAALEGSKCAGAVAIGDGSSEACVDILSAADGRKFVAQISAPLGVHDITTTFGKVRGVVAVIRFNALLSVEKWYKGVDGKFVNGADLMGNEIGDMVYRDFLPGALGQGRFVAAPSPVVVGHGLDTIQEAMDMNRKGMSVGKAVVTLA